MSCKKIRIIFRFSFLTAIILYTSLNHIHASGFPDIMNKNLLYQEKNSLTDQTTKVSEPKKIMVMSAPEGQKLLIRPRERIENRQSEKGFQWGQSCLKEERTFKDRKEAEAYIYCLLEERKVLEGDFYGLNLTAYRYVNIFYRRGYIQHKIFNIDKEIKRTKSALRDTEK